MPIHTCPHAYTPKVVLDKTCQTGFGSSETGFSMACETGFISSETGFTVPRQTGFDETGFSETGFVTATVEAGFGYRFPVRFEVIAIIGSRMLQRDSAISA